MRHHAGPPVLNVLAGGKIHFDALRAHFSFFLKLCGSPLTFRHPVRYVPAMEPLTISKRSARMLLSAWTSADPERIRNAADHANAMNPACTSEAERIEIIREAGCILRQSAAGASTSGNASASEELDASLRLLRHLAGA
jgi:hypothetical protein